MNPMECLKDFQHELNKIQRHPFTRVDTVHVLCKRTYGEKRRGFELRAIHRPNPRLSKAS